MVNKQYTVQPARKLPNNSSPQPYPFSASVAVISASNGGNVTNAMPNGAVNNLDAASDNQRARQQQKLASLASGGQKPLHPATLGGAVYARNIAYVHNHHSGAGTRSEVTGLFATDGGLEADRMNPNLDKDVAIKDIGRFQYILQMDREMATHPNSPAYRLHPHPNASAGSGAASASSGSSNNSVSDSINSTNQHHHQHNHQFSFWKAGGSHDPITYGAGSGYVHVGARRRWLHRLQRLLNLFWLYAKWPLAAMFACSVVATLVYFVLVASTDSGDYDADMLRSPGHGMHNEDFVRFDAIERHLHQPDTQDNRLGDGDGQVINRTAQLMQLLEAVGPLGNNAHENDSDSPSVENESISGRLAIFVQDTAGNSNDDSNSDAVDNFNDDLLLRYPLGEYDDETIQFGNPALKPALATAEVFSTHTSSDKPPTQFITRPVTQPAEPAVTKRFRNTQIIEISTPKFNTKPTATPSALADEQQPLQHNNVAVSIVPNSLPIDQAQRPRVASTLMFPTRETFEIFAFTSGHQNNFGVPIEEDERMLRILNEQLLQAADGQRNGTDASGATIPPSATTDSTLSRTRVSPTLPNLRLLAATTERQTTVNPRDEGLCRSTALSLCRSVLPYDLTSAEHSNTNLTVQDVDHFKYLVESQCSARAHEFICSVLQPECRPERMGILQPCKRSCKAILEPCGHVIAASEFLTAAFDCDSFPDSHDPNECRDATRESECLANEFKCDDHSCIPNQWRCDNIKDCSEAEDEIECTFCAHDEFRCPNSDKCIPDKWRCDEYDDCPDASDELECDFGEESRTYPSTQGHGRTFPYTQELSASRAALGSSTDRPESERPLWSTTDGSRARKQSEDELLAAASGISLPLSKSLANFQDSKEIMMTSDSETDFKFATRSTLESDQQQTQQAPVKAPATLPAELESANQLSPCPVGELRCVSGTCITVSQLCDKIVDCPDGADEAMCVYKTLDVQ